MLNGSPEKSLATEATEFTEKNQDACASGSLGELCDYIVVMPYIKNAAAPHRL
jgi:hypothetical protein